MLELNKIYNLDCEQGMKELIPNNSIDLTLTSPPYDKLRTYNNSLKWDFEIFTKIAIQLYRITKIGGVVVWVVGDATINGSETGTSFKQALFFKELGFNLHDTMIYKKINPVPLTHRRYEQAFEYMFVLSKRKPKTFNPLKESCKTKGAYKNRRASGRPKEAALRNRDELTETKEIKQKTNIWEYFIGSKTDTGNHPAIFPEQLASDHILSWSNEGDTILEPFAGSGTTIKQAILLNRNWIAFEKVKEYYELSLDRITDTLLSVE